ncbi:MAG: hypothetical protein ACSNEK_01955 [Parachlamydiaceae bacterium]
MKLPIFTLLLLSLFTTTFASSPQVMVRQEDNPTFYIQPDRQSIHWQISDTEHFDWIHPSMEGVTEENMMNLPEEARAEMITGQDYYFRCRTFDQDEIGPWTNAESFNFWMDVPMQSAWVKSQSLDQDTWEHVLPYLLPFNHPLKKKLDGIFTKHRATASAKALEKAGFSSLDFRQGDHIVVAVHDKLKGYLVKAYLDNQTDISDVDELTKRVTGALTTQQAIDDLDYHHFFKVPKKWLYPLPDTPNATAETHKKHFILIVEDIRLVSDLTNQKKWKKHITKEQLKALYTLLNRAGLQDSVFITNLPFSKDGKITFVNTERHDSWPVPFYKLTHFLSPEMQTYWNHLIMTNGQS